jgi:hypothetical protein
MKEFQTQNNTKQCHHIFQLFIIWIWVWVLNIKHLMPGNGQDGQTCSMRWLEGLIIFYVFQGICWSCLNTTQTFAISVFLKCYHPKRCVRKIVIILTYITHSYTARPLLLYGF